MLKRNGEICQAEVPDYPGRLTAIELRVYKAAVASVENQLQGLAEAAAPWPISKGKSRKGRAASGASAFADCVAFVARIWDLCAGEQVSRNSPLPNGGG